MHQNRFHQRQKSQALSQDYQNKKMNIALNREGTANNSGKINGAGLHRSPYNTSSKFSEWSNPRTSEARDKNG